MKWIGKIFLFAFISFGLSFSSLNAIGNKSRDDVQYYNKEVKGYQYDSSRAVEKEKSKTGNAISNTGSAVKSGAAGAGKGVVKAGKWTGKTVSNGASWTYDNAKHNKVTKNVFNQPGDE